MTIVRTMGMFAALFVILPVAAHADLFSATAGPSNCASCYGGTYTLDLAGSGTTFTVTLTIATPSADSVVVGQYISGVNFGAGTQILSAQLLAAPAGGAWSNVLGNINSSGACDGAPPANKVCSQQNSDNPPYTLAVANGGIYTWQWAVVFEKPITELGYVHIGAQYQDDGGSNGHIVSENATVPEPATAATLGMGLLLLAFRLRRSK